MAKGANPGSRATKSKTVPLKVDQPKAPLKPQKKVTANTSKQK